ncbi:MAG: THUMP domain-containing protein [Candidatus Nitrosocaldus sp.]|nr:THUMP domain-containing protein [Candidatus Nitrosocaldus sp.]MDW8274971.1 THUMP domain-containing protein [Candidatus Nitrosocaldus sp.]
MLRLCHHCAMRQGLDASNGMYLADGDSCYICDGLMRRLDDIFALVEDAIKDYEFRSFLIGATLPTRMIEREDEVRARLKVRGLESIKSNITRELGMRLSARGLRVDYERPDIDVHVDLIRMAVNVRARPIYLLATYRKSRRGLRQKGDENSIESMVRGWLLRGFRASDARFLWVGGEDRESLVLNDGRPFFIKVVDAKRRYRYPDRFCGDGVEVTIVREVDGFPRQIRFVSRIRLHIAGSDPSMIGRVSAVRDVTVRFGEHGREVAKRMQIIDAIYDSSTGVLLLDLLVDGGFMVKRFAEGVDVEPSMHDLLGGGATLMYFDVLEVRMVN